jgi:hypothetical protein
METTANPIHDLIVKYRKYADKVVKYYIEDLLKDEEQIAEECVPGNKGKVYFVLRECGSHTVVLTDDAKKDLPEPNVEVKILFGKGKRADVARFGLEVLEYEARQIKQGSYREVYALDVAKKTLNKSDIECAIYDAEKWVASC